jgi:hypothetical protein
VTASASGVVLGGTIQFNVNGGIGQYSYSVSAGAQSTNTSGLYTVNSATGPLSMTVTDTVTSAAAAAPVAFMVYAPLSVTPANPTITVGSSIQLTASGGTGSYQWAATGGSVVNGLYTASSGAGTFVVTLTNPSVQGGPSFAPKDATITVTSSGGGGCETNQIPHQNLMVTIGNQAAELYGMGIVFTANTVLVPSAIVAGQDLRKLFVVSSVDNGGAMNASVKSVVMHPNFNPDIIGADNFAVVTLNENLRVFETCPSNFMAVFASDAFDADKAKLTLESQFRPGAEARQSPVFGGCEHCSGHVCCER